MSTKKPTFGELLLQGAREALAHTRGELEDVRVDRVQVTAREATVTPPPRYDAERIRGIRERMRLSQRLFAAALNVSLPTVRAWETGKRTPEGPTLRLLELAEKQPEYFLATVRGKSSAA